MNKKNPAKEYPVRPGQFAMIDHNRLEKANGTLKLVPKMEKMPKGTKKSTLHKVKIFDNVRPFVTPGFFSFLQQNASRFSAYAIYESSGPAHMYPRVRVVIASGKKAALFLKIGDGLEAILDENSLNYSFITFYSNSYGVNICGKPVEINGTDAFYGYYDEEDDKIIVEDPICFDLLELAMRRGKL